MISKNLYTKLNENPIIQVNDELFEALISNPIYQKTAIDLSKKLYELNQKTLHVFQREFATISSKDNFDWIGSGEATTCVIVLLYNEQSHRASAGHFDGADNQITGEENCSLFTMIRSFSEEEKIQGIRIHLVGGYCDDNKTGKSIIMKLLQVLSTASADIYLDTFMVDRLNTQQKPKIGNIPITRGAAMNCKTGQVILVSTFKNRGPEISLRMILSFLGTDELKNIYDSQTKCFTLGPYYYKPWVKEAKSFMNCNDKELLQNLSTSPSAEGPNFVSDMRKSLLFVTKNPDCEQYFKGKPLIYQCNAEYIWQRISNK